MKYYSYYDILGMVEEGRPPKRVKISIGCKSMVYVAEYDNDEFSHYYIENDKLIDENFRLYLNEDFLESTVFEKNIEILDENVVIPLLTEDDSVQDIRDKVNEIIYYISDKIS